LEVTTPFRSLAEFKFKNYAAGWLVLAQGVMPKLQRLKLSFNPRKRNGGGFDVCLENLNSLEHVTIELINCNRMREAEQHMETKIREGIGIHPNHPTLELSIRN
jgi:hypothetical protein